MKYITVCEKCGKFVKGTSIDKLCYQIDFCNECLVCYHESNENLKDYKKDAPIEVAKNKKILEILMAGVEATLKKQGFEIEE